MFKSTFNRGFSLTFENNLTISVQFGSVNYCANRNYHLDYKHELSNDITECINAEIAIWDNSGKWFNFGNDEVKGYLKTDEIATWIMKVKKAKNIKALRK